jgi:hypothetical protein
MIRHFITIQNSLGRTRQALVELTHLFIGKFLIKRIEQKYNIFNCTVH